MSDVDLVLSQLPGVGDLFGSNQRIAERQAREARTRQLAEYNTLQDILTPLDGTYGPSLLDRTLVGPSGLESLQPDRQANDAQRFALRGYQDIYREGGLTSTDRARIQQAQFANAQAERGQREAIMQQMAARGMSGSGQAFAGALSAQQGAANRNSQQALAIEEMAQQRRDAALQGMYNVGTGIRGQTWSEGAQRAGARDAINRYNSQMHQQDYLNRSGLASMRAGVYSADQAAAQQRAAESRAAQQGAINSIITAGATAAGGPAGGAAASQATGGGAGYPYQPIYGTSGPKKE